jgi:hypothetical protein
VCLIRAFMVTMTRTVMYMTSYRARLSARAAGRGLHCRASAIRVPKKGRLQRINRDNGGAGS